MVWRSFIALLLGSIVALAWALYAQWLRIPDQLNPWAQLDVAAAPNFLTRYKLGRLSKDSEACQSVLTTTQMKYTPIDDEMTGDACGFFNAVRISRTTADVGSNFALTCRSAVSLALWERHVVQPNAERFYGSKIAKIEHFGSYSCRNVYGRPNSTRSRHATAEAFDVAGFVLANGKRIRVINDWTS